MVVQCGLHPTGDRPSSKDNKGLKAVLQKDEADYGRVCFHFLRAHSSAGMTRHEG